MRWCLVGVVGLVACDGAPSTEPTPVTTPTLPTETDPVPTADTAEPHDTDIPLPEVDCSTPPSGPFSGRQLNTPRGYHGLAFDAFGNLVGGDNTNLIISSDSNTSQILVPNIGRLQQMAYLPSGDLAVAVDQGDLIQSIAPSGARTTLASGINAYGVEIGPDGFIYTANQNVVHRVDPNGGGAVVVVPNGVLDTPKVLTFDRLGTQMFVGTNFSSGEVWRFEIDLNGDPVTPGTLIGSTGGSWHDGLGMDACGRLYLAEFNTRSLYMIEQGSGSVQLIDYNETPLGSAAYGHGLTWGSGIGEWDDHKMYVPLPYNGDRVAEIDLGVPHKDFNGGEYTTSP